VELCGVGDLLAAFLKRKPHTLHWMESRTGNPGISLVFREMWDSANLNLRPIGLARFWGPSTTLRSGMTNLRAALSDGIR
jgi:hypothetical protein